MWEIWFIGSGFKCSEVMGFKSSEVQGGGMANYPKPFSFQP